MGGKKPASVSRREICWITCESAFVVVSAIAMASGKDDVIRSNARQNVMALVVTRKGFTRETSAHGGPAVMTRSACGYILRIARMRARMLLTLCVTEISRYSRQQRLPQPCALCRASAARRATAESSM